MNLKQLNRVTLIVGIIFLAVGIGSVALTMQQSLSSEQWTQWTSGGEAPRSTFTGSDDPASRGWGYETYLSKHSDENKARGACALSSLDGSVCALGGFAALSTWLGFIVTGIALGLFYTVRTRTDLWKVA